MSEGDYDRDGWRPSWKPGLLPTHLIADLPDRDDLAVDPVPMIFSPVETETGNEVRLMAIASLARRGETLRERAKHQRLTGVEQRELMGTQAATHTLERMAPVGALKPSTAGDLFSGNLP